MAVSSVSAAILLWIVIVHEYQVIHIGMLAMLNFAIYLSCGGRLSPVGRTYFYMPSMFTNFWQLPPHFWQLHLFLGENEMNYWEPQGHTLPNAKEKYWEKTEPQCKPISVSGDLNIGTVTAGCPTCNQTPCICPCDDADQSPDLISPISWKITPTNDGFMYEVTVKRARLRAMVPPVLLPPVVHNLFVVLSHIPVLLPPAAPGHFRFPNAYASSGPNDTIIYRFWEQAP